MEKELENQIKAKKTDGYDKPTIWIKFTKLALGTGSVNLGQGFPDWQPPKFLIDSLNKHISSQTSNHQYTRTMGNLKLVESLAQSYSPVFKRELDPLSEILVGNGAVSLLYNVITSLIHQGDEMIVIEGFYDCYLPQALFSGGKVIGIPMIPPQVRQKSEYHNLTGNSDIKIKDKWEIDFDKLESSFSDKTKVLILNTPNNPTGKILTFDEMHKIKKMLDKFPNVTLIMDEVYEHMIYDEYETLPRFATLEGMWDRTVSIMSAGKIFSATGIRIGWAIGSKSIIQKAAAIYQYNSFCLYDPVQLAIADALQIAQNPFEGYENYYKWLRANYMEKRNYFVESLSKIENFDLPFWLPEGGYFIICDINKKENEPKHKFEGEEKEENKYSKDFNFILNMAHEKKVVGIPCTPFYIKEHVSKAENLIRLAFCKKKETMDKALENFSKF
jgi:kynurenine--oxoglutarate transaminase/cysteine-S-conjugate beta-lyase/glutamine--phenylpyruvate transaminase